jgi:hypothetical protein
MPLKKITNFDARLLPYYQLVLLKYNSEVGKNSLLIEQVDVDTYSLYGDMGYKDFRKYVKKHSCEIKESLGLSKRLSFRSKKWDELNKRINENVDDLISTIKRKD